MDKILEQVIAIVEETMDAEDVTADTLMQEDLGIGSLEFYELLNNLEVEFGIKMSERALSAAETVGDIAQAVLELKK